MNLVYLYLKSLCLEIIFLNKFVIAQYLGDDQWKILEPIKNIWKRNNSFHN